MRFGSQYRAVVAVAPWREKVKVEKAVIDKTNLEKCLNCTKAKCTGNCEKVRRNGKCF